MDKKELKAILDPIIPCNYLLFEFDKNNELLTINSETKG